MSKASMLELTQLTDANTSRKVWVNVPLIGVVVANINNTFEVRMQDGSSFAISQTDFNTLKNQGFEVP